MNNEEWTNPFIRRLIADGEVSEASLKRLFKRQVKAAHPDLTGGGSAEFIILKRDYEEALRILREHPVRSSEPAGDPRRSFYASLLRYTAAGLHSERVRVKPELRDRNESLIRQVFDAALAYSPDFVPIFSEYTAVSPRTFAEWQQGKKTRGVRRCLSFGLHWFFDYQQGGSERARRTAVSFLRDAQDAADRLPPEAGISSIGKLARWLLNELALPSLAGRDGAAAGRPAARRE